MADVMTVSDFLLRLGVDPDHPERSDLISPLRLQKLLYYAQGLSLALLGRPLFPDRILAGRNGPVVESVYRHYESWGARGIEPDDPSSTNPLSATEQQLIRTAWNEYGRYSSLHLDEMARREPAWRDARGELPSDAECNVPLSLDTMARFFADKVRALAAKHRWPDPRADWEAEEQLNRGQGRSLPDLIAARRSAISES